MTLEIHSVYAAAAKRKDGHIEVFGCSFAKDNAMYIAKQHIEQEDAELRDDTIYCLLKLDGDIPSFETADQAYQRLSHTSAGKEAESEEVSYLLSGEVQQTDTGYRYAFGGAVLLSVECRYVLGERGRLTKRQQVSADISRIRRAASLRGLSLSRRELRHAALCLWRLYNRKDRETLPEPNFESCATPYQRLLEDIEHMKYELLRLEASAVCTADVLRPALYGVYLTALYDRFHELVIGQEKDAIDDMLRIMEYCADRIDAITGHLDLLPEQVRIR